VAWRDTEREKFGLLRSTAENVGKVLQEVQYNGGRSVKDMVRVLSRDVAMERQARRIGYRCAHYDTVLDLVSGDMRTTHASPEFLWLTGLTIEGMYGDAWLRVVDPMDRQRVAEMWDDAQERGVPMDIEYKLLNLSTGTRQMVRHIAEPVKDHLSRLIGWVGVINPTSGVGHEGPDTEVPAR